MLLDTTVFQAIGVAITRKKLEVPANGKTIDLVHITITAMVNGEAVEIRHEVAGDNVTLVTDKPQVPEFLKFIDPKHIGPTMAQEIADMFEPTAHETIEVVHGNCVLRSYKSPLWFLRATDDKFYYISQTIVEDKKYYGVTWYREEKR